MDNKEQLNVVIPKKLAEKLRVDAAKSNRNLGDVAATIFADFFKAWTQSERKKFYEKIPTKASGRKIKLKAA